MYTEAIFVLKGKKIESTFTGILLLYKLDNNG